MAAKDFLYSWLGKHKKVAPLYNIEQTQRGGILRFKCDVRVPGYSYVGMGNSTKKKVGIFIFFSFFSSENNLIVTTEHTVMKIPQRVPLWKS